MPKRLSKLDKAIADIDDQIAALQLARKHLLAQQGQQMPAARPQTAQQSTDAVNEG